jgi:hypothetical protein
VLSADAGDFRKYFRKYPSSPPNPSNHSNISLRAEKSHGTTVSARQSFAGCSIADDTKSALPLVCNDVKPVRRPRSGESGPSPHRHHAEPGVEVYVDVQNQAAWPSGKCAKFSYGSRDNRDAGFNFDPQVIAVADKMLLHRLDCLD